MGKCSSTILESNNFTKREIAGVFKRGKVVLDCSQGYYHGGAITGAEHFAMQIHLISFRDSPTNVDMDVILNVYDLVLAPPTSNLTFSVGAQRSARLRRNR